MQVQKQQQKQWLKQFQVQDLTRALIRQYFMQHQLHESLQCFENEQKKKSKKISKSILIKMLSMHKLCELNKQLNKPYKSLLEVLVNYLKDKFRSRMDIGRPSQSDVHGGSRKMQDSNKNISKQGSEYSRVDRSVNSTENIKKQQELQHKNGELIKRKIYNNFMNDEPRPQYRVKNSRPVTSGAYKRKNVEVIYAQLRKQQARIAFAQKEQQERRKNAKQRQQMQRQIAIKLKIQQQKQQRRKQQLQNQRMRVEQEQRIKQKQRIAAQQQRKMQQLQKQIEKQQRQKRERQQKKKLDEINKIKQQERKRKHEQEQEQKRKEGQKKKKQEQERVKLEIEQKKRKQKQNKQNKQRQQKQRQQKQKQEKQEKLKKQKQEQLKKQKQNKEIQDRQRQKQQLQKKLKQQQAEKKRIKQQQQQKQRKHQQQLKQQQLKKVELKRKEEQQKQRQRIQKQAKQRQQQQAKYEAQFILQPPKQQIKVEQPIVPIKQSGRIGMRKLLKKKQPQPQIVVPVQQPKKQQITQQISEMPQIQSQFVLKEEAPAVKVQIAVQPQAVVEPKKQQNNGKMMKIMGRKKKGDIQQKPEQAPTKFKFDENFVDEPLRPQLQNYTYEKIQINKITLKHPMNPQINYRDKFVSGNKKYFEKSITEQQAQQLKKVVLQNGPSVLPKSWFQGFILSPSQATPYGLKQIQGGPCGIIAAVQCYFLKHLLYLANLTNQQLSNEQIRENCLVAAIADLLFKCKSSQLITLALPPKSFSGTKLDPSSFRIITIQSPTLPHIYQAIHNYRSAFIGKNNHGVAVLMYCAVMTKGIYKISQQIDIAENPLIGNHGHCTQELVNLFITGEAVSNVFDGVHVIDSQVKLRGIRGKAEFGFLTIFQTLKYIQVGKNLKNPVYPFWIICKQFHYHVIFASHYLISQNNNTPKFDIVYFDGLYNCDDRIVITLQKISEMEKLQQQIKVKDLPLIQQVMMTKWGLRRADWNGSVKIL